MSFGDLITLPYQYEFRNYLAGSGTEVIIETVDGLLDLPDVEHTIFDREDAHGAFMGVSRLKRRVLDVDFFILGSALDIEDKIDKFSRAFNFTAESHPFVFSRRSMPDRFINCRVDKRQIPSEYSTANGLVEGSLQLVAPDPRIYSVMEREVTFTIPAGVSSGQAVVQNHGNFESAPTVTIQGEADSPRISNSADPDRQTAFNLDTAAGSTMEINSKTRTIMHNGGEITHLLVTGSDFIKIKPGDNTITVNRTGTVGTATVTVRFRDVWV